METTSLGTATVNVKHVKGTLWLNYVRMYVYNYGGHLLQLFIQTWEWGLQKNGCGL